MEEVILSLLAIAFVLYLLLCPIVAWVSARNAHAKLAELEQTVRDLKKLLTATHRDSAEATIGQPQTSEFAQPIAKEIPPDLSIPTMSTNLPEQETQAAGTRHEAEADNRRIITPDPWQEAESHWKNRELRETPTPAWVNKLKAWLFGGNLIVKLALLIIFLGVSFGLKLASERYTVPIEFRLAGIVLADIALLIWAWRIREKRPAISLPVQGTAVAIMMLVTFAAFKIYHLLPSTLAFAMLFVLTAFTCLLAVLQDAVWLAVFGIAGGFAAPILTMTGGGSHIGLFSYYAILNAGILAIASYRSWRLLNLVGFAFTFIIGTAWGVLRYIPEHYLSAQLFLILFFVFYVLISLLHAHRQAPNLKHYVDGILVFGTPLVAFGLQYGLVKNTPFGLAYSSLALGLFYISAAVLLWQKRGTNLKLLTESFLALGVVFGTLTIPFALDGRWTSAAWALEGAGMVWVGLRQRQTLAWVFGLLVQFGAWMSFIGSVAGLDQASAVQSNLWLGFLLLAATAFLMAVNFRSQANESQPVSFTPLATVFLALAGIWMLAGTWAEIALRTDGALQANLLAMSGLVVALILGVIASRMHWRVARGYALFAQILAGIVFLSLTYFRHDSYGEPGLSLFAGPFLGALLIGMGAFFSSWLFHRMEEVEYFKLSNRLLGWSGFWWFAFVLYEWANWLHYQYRLSLNLEPYRTDGLFWSAYGLSMALFTLGYALLAQRLRWAELRWSGLSVWILLSLFSLIMLGDLYFDDGMPHRETWLTYLVLWGVGEWLMVFWKSNRWIINDFWLRFLHTLRTVGPWMMIWPVGYRLITDWLGSGTAGEQELLAEAGWFASGSWARYLPAWLMMLVIAWVMRRTRSGGWPVEPIAGWYRRALTPLGAAWSILLVAIWNLTQNGLMSPLPYLPLLNPLDLTTGFSLLLGLEVFRELSADDDMKRAKWFDKVPWVTSLSAYAWFNLMLLRSVAAYGDIHYQFDTLFDSHFVQTLLSLVWSATALILMRLAAQRKLRKVWLLGSVLLGIVVAKLFLVDLSNIGGVERIISFVGVGLLMLAIGYLAPFPTELDRAADDDESVAPKTKP